MDKATVTLRSKVGDFAVTFNDPNGKPIIFRWSKANNFTLEIPKVIMFTDIRGVKKVAAEDYATDLLNAYGKEEYKRKDGGALVLDKDENKIVVRQAILELVEVKVAPVEAKITPAITPVPEKKKVDTGSIEFAK